MKWTRPESVPFPSVWAEYTGKRALPCGRVPHFRIQDATEDMFDEIVEHMKTIFLKDEPISENCSFTEDPVSVREIMHVWRSVLNHKVALVALDVADDGTTKLAGLNITGISEGDVELKFEGKPMTKILGLLESMSKKADVFTRYGVTEYLTALGLSVAPEYRGQGLGLEILKARVPLCKAVGLKVTCTVFTAGNSQHLARKAGFEVSLLYSGPDKAFELLHEMEYADYKVNGEVAFPGLKVKMCQTMALKIE